MIYRGHIENGVAVFDSKVVLPEGTPVLVEVQRGDEGFWASQSIEALAQEQGVGPVTSLAQLAIDWPESESIDDFLALVREVRK